MQRKLIYIQEGVSLSTPVYLEQYLKSATGWLWTDEDLEDYWVGVGVLPSGMSDEDRVLLSELLFDEVETVLQYLHIVEAAISLLCDDQNGDLHSESDCAKVSVLTLAKQTAFIASRLLEIYRELSRVVYKTLRHSTKVKCFCREAQELEMSNMGSESVGIGELYKVSVISLDYVELSGTLLEFSRNIIAGKCQDCGEGMLRALDVCKTGFKESLFQ